MITLIVDTLPVFYYEKMVGDTRSNFVDLVFTGERIEVGLKRGKFDHLALMNEKIGTNGGDEEEEGNHVVAVIPRWPCFPPAQQCHYPPPNHPQGSSLNQPQSLPTAHPMPNTTFRTSQNINQGRNFAAKKPVQFTPIPVSYANLLPYLLDNSMVAITPAKAP